jgi:transcriptional regulator with GAF, ATPase, and Fis domain
VPAGPLYSPRNEYGDLIGLAPASRRLFAFLERLESVNLPVLITGETGTGKDLVAHEIHRHSSRKDAPFEVVDCAALPATLIESELLGHTRGAFTGAQTDYRGAFERANHGTLFLDELGELPLDLQPKLLRVLETREVRRLGGSKVQLVDVRLLAATNRDLAEEVRQGRFRKDLFYRLNAVTMQIAPLRERREDIPPLIASILRGLGNEGVPLSAETRELFTTGYDWPGNVRELKNALASAVALDMLPKELQLENAAPTKQPTPAGAGTYHEEKRRMLDAFERDFLEAKLRESGGNLSQAARAAHVERNYFKKLLRKHGITKDDAEP